MTWQTPTWYALVLLGLAAFRTWRILAEDSITAERRARLSERTRSFVTCPWCLGFWITLLWWLAWIAWPHWTLIIAAPLAISAVVGLIAANIDPVD